MRDGEGVRETKHSTMTINLLETMKPSQGACLLGVLGGCDESRGPKVGCVQHGWALGGSGEAI